eukprot:1574677-Rhodomonas_salina.1
MGEWDYIINLSSTDLPLRTREEMCNLFDGADVRTMRMMRMMMMMKMHRPLARATGLGVRSRWTEGRDVVRTGIDSEAVLSLQMYGKNFMWGVRQNHDHQAKRSPSPPSPTPFLFAFSAMGYRLLMFCNVGRVCVAQLLRDVDWWP